MYHSDVTNVGTFREKDAKLTYDPEVNGGTLTAQGDDWAESISNRNVAAVVTHSTGVDAAEGSQKILFVSDQSEPTSDGTSADYKLEAIEATNLPQSFVDANLNSPRITRLAKPKAERPAHNFYVVISTRSGTGKAQHYFDDVIKPAFAAIGIQEFAYYVHTTYSDKSVSDFASAVLLPRANEGAAQTVLLLSGDGGIVDIVNAALSARRSDKYVKPSIGLIAMGTGNAFANSTGLNRDATRGLRHFLRGDLHSIPTFTAIFSRGSEFLVDEGRQTEALPSSNGILGTFYGAVVCSWALHASLVADSDTTELRKFGSQRFQMAAKDLLAPSDGSPPHPYKGQITLFTKDDQGKEVQKALDRPDHMYILATMVSNLEEKLTISPESKPLDGQLRLLHFGSISSAEVMRILGLAFQGGQHVKDEVVRYDAIEGMRIKFDEEDGRWRRVCVDGKIIQVGKGGWVEVRKNKNADVLDIVADL